MTDPTVTRGVATWVVMSGLFSLFVGCGACVEQVGKGEWGAGFVSLLMIPILFWLLATIGAGVINVLTISGQVMTGQVTESEEIQRKD
jgi:hypothetical protein